MGAQWKHAGRIANANKRGAVVGKLAKEIIVAAKSGDPNPDNNARLRAAVEAAKKASVPRDTIERAIKKGAGLLDDQVQYETVVFEGFTPHQVPLIVECVTDNRNRTASDVRILFRKGQLGSMGSVAWMFDRLGTVEATHPDQAKLDLEGVAIEAGAQEVEKQETGEVRFLCAPTDLDAVSKHLSANGWTLASSEIGYVPKNSIDLNDDQRKEVMEFLNAVDDNDDVHRIYVALK